ncbi:MAG: ATP-dependent Clp protease adaptor ClpS [Candidatus Hydrogenedentota bacterium]
MSERQGNPGSGTALEERIDLQRPKRYKVLLHNDHYTTMEFVVEVLEAVFNKAREEAVQVMLAVHEEGVGIAGVYTAQVAETKIAAVHALAEENGFPLKCSMAPE